MLDTTGDMRSSDPQLIACLLLLTSVIPSCGQCSSTGSIYSPEKACIDVFKLLQKVLFNNTYNAFQLQSVFYPSSRITPALVRVNFTLMNKTALSTEPIFDCTLSNPCTFAWTFRSLYQFFHPAVLNQLQFQLPFVLMRLTARSLSDEPNLDAFLWDGTNNLPTVLLNLTIIEPNSLPDNRLKSYLQSNKIVKNALGEVTKWLKAYANVEPKGENIMMMLRYTDVNLKAYTLNGSAVNQFTYSQSAAGVDMGMQLLFFVLTIDFVIALILAPIFMILLAKTFTTSLRSNSKSYSSSLITGAGAVSAMFCLMTWIAELYQLHKFVHVNGLIDAKLTYLAILYAWSFFVSLVSTLAIHHSEYRQIKGNRENQRPLLAIRWWIVVYVAGSTIVGFSSHVLLILAPTVIFLFVHPVDVSSLLFLHVAMMYSMTVLLAIFIFQMRQWQQYELYGRWVDSFIWCVYLLYMCFIAAVIPLSYKATIDIHQFIFARNFHDQLATNVLATNIPSVVIVLFTWLLNRSFSENDNNTKEKRLIQMITSKLQQLRAIMNPESQTRRSS